MNGHIVAGGVNLALRKLSQDPYLSVDEMQSGVEVTVVGKPIIVPAEQTKWGKARGRVVVKLANGETRTWTMNNTTWDRCVDAFGSNPEGWLGRKLTIDVQMMSVRGETKKVIFGAPVAQKTPAQQFSGF